MHDAYRRIAALDNQTDLGLRNQHRVGVVQHRVDRVRGPSVVATPDCRLEALAACLTPVYTCAYTPLRGWLRVGSSQSRGESREAQGPFFADAALSLEDPRALTMPDPGAGGEERYIALDADPMGQVLVTVFAHAGANIRIISARRASPGERKRYERR